MQTSPDHVHQWFPWIAYLHLMLRIAEQHTAQKNQDFLLAQVRRYIFKIFLYAHVRDYHNSAANVLRYSHNIRSESADKKSLNTDEQC